MEHKFMIVPGDEVIIQLDANGQGTIVGTVRSMPCATGEAIVVTNAVGVHYIQQYYVMTYKATP